MYALRWTLILKSYALKAVSCIILRRSTKAAVLDVISRLVRKTAKDNLNTSLFESIKASK